MTKGTIWETHAFLLHAYDHKANTPSSYTPSEQQQQQTALAAACNHCGAVRAVSGGGATGASAAPHRQSAQVSLL